MSTTQERIKDLRITPYYETGLHQAQVDPDDGDVNLVFMNGEQRVMQFMKPTEVRALHAWLGKVLTAYAANNDGEGGTSGKVPEPMFSGAVLEAMRNDDFSALADAYSYIETDGPVGGTWIANVIQDAYHQGAIDQAFSA